MSKAIALSRKALRNGADRTRVAVVLGCAVALILAGRALPF